MVGSSSYADSRKTEIVSLTEGSAIPDCLDALSDHPNHVSDAAGGALPDAGKIKLTQTRKIVWVGRTDDITVNIRQRDTR